MPDNPTPPRRTSIVPGPLVRLGIGLVVLGLIDVVAFYAVAVARSAAPPLTLYLLTLTLPLGMLVAGVGVARNYRRPR